MKILQRYNFATNSPNGNFDIFPAFFLTDVAGMRPDMAGWVVGIGKLANSRRGNDEKIPPIP
jgi:hypothetical protein